MSDKMKHQAEEAKGRLKETAGDATDNERMQAEGRGEQSSAQAKQAGDKVKDALADGKESLRKATDR
jgi:uncharacterized protein YjbJ (UPF0337 family)